MKEKTYLHLFQSTFLENSLIFFAVLFHLIISGFPLVNLEWAFSDAALFFEKGEYNYIEQYFIFQANTLGVPFVTFLLAKVLPFLKISIIPRLLSAIGFIFLGKGLLKINRILKTSIPGYIVLLVVFLNPLLWTFGGRGTADFFPAALSVFGLAVYWEQSDNSWKKLIAIIIIGFSIILKYHSILILIPLVVEIFIRPDQKVKIIFIRIGKLLFGTLILPIVYIILIKQKFGFWLAPPIYLGRHGLSTSYFFTNFFTYFGYMATLLVPFSILPTIYFLKQSYLFKRESNIFASLFFGILFFFVGYFWIRPQGEMNFGPLDGIINDGLLGGIFMVLVLVMIFIFFLCFKRIYLERKMFFSNRHLLSLIIGIIGFLFVLSFTRPAQRYLMFILPLAIFLLPMTLANKKTVFLTTTIYFLINIFLLYNQYTSGTATEMMVSRLHQKGIIEKTDPGVINVHAGNIFFPYRKSIKEYTIVSGAPLESIITVRVGQIPFAKKTFSLILLPKPYKKTN